MRARVLWIAWIALMGCGSHEEPAAHHEHTPSARPAHRPPPSITPPGLARRSPAPSLPDLATVADCLALTQSINEAAERFGALQEPTGGSDDPVAILEPMAAASERSATEIAAVHVADTSLAEQRDALAALYGEEAVAIRADAREMADALRTDDQARMAAVNERESEFPAREEAILRSIGERCGMGP